MKTSIFKRLNSPIDPIPKVFRIGNLRQALALGLIILLVVISYSSLSCIEGSRKPVVFLIFLGALLFMLYRFEITDLFYLFLAFVFFLGSECFYKHFYNLVILYYRIPHPYGCSAYINRLSLQVCRELSLSTAPANPGAQSHFACHSKKYQYPILDSIQ